MAGVIVDYGLLENLVPGLQQISSPSQHKNSQKNNKRHYMQTQNKAIQASTMTRATAAVFGPWLCELVLS